MGAGRSLFTSKITKQVARSSPPRSPSRFLDHHHQEPQADRLLFTTKPKIIQKSAQPKKPIVQDRILQDPKIIEEIVTAQQVVHRPMDVTQIQVVEEIVDVLEVKQVGVPAIQVVQKVVKKGRSVESVTRRRGVWRQP